MGASRKPIWPFSFGRAAIDTRAPATTVAPAGWSTPAPCASLPSLGPLFRIASSSARSAAQSSPSGPSIGSFMRIAAVRDAPPHRAGLDTWLARRRGPLARRWPSEGHLHRGGGFVGCSCSCRSLRQPKLSVPLRIGSDFDYLMLTRIFPTAVCRADDDSGERT